MGAIELDGLTKRYGDIAANDGVSFTVEPGEIFGYLGPNGAGKTTTIRLLLGLLKPTAGSATVLGTDIRDRRALAETRARVGYLPDALGFEGQLTGEQVLEHFARMRGDERRERLLELFRPPLEQPVERYSAGNRRMLGIVQAFMHDPELVIMDEPTSGLDPLKQDRMHEFLRAERERGTTLFLSSHVLSEVQQVCDRVGVIRDGALVALEEIDTLRRERGKRLRVEFGEPPEGVRIDGMYDVSVTDRTLECSYTGEYDALFEQLGGFDIEDIELKDPDLADVFKQYYRGEEGES